LTLLVPILQDQGLSYREAVTEADLGQHFDHRLSGEMSQLPNYATVLDRHVLGAREVPRDEVQRFGRIGNPTVHIGLGELRRLINT
jgi:CRISPR-associated endonuclease Csn1